MSGIPIYTRSPISPSKASGITRQTAEPGTQTVPVAPNTVPATTTTSSSTISYPPAQPGAANHYTPVQPTPTTKTDNDDPPRPQPGAVPSPSRKSPIPPPPKAGESYPPTQRTAAPAPSSMPKPYSPQMWIPPPTAAVVDRPPSSSTTTTTAPSSRYPVPLPTSEYGAPRRSLEHPPGYYQNVYASELTNEQRRAQEANNSSGLGGYGSSDKGNGMDAESLWNTAKQWVTVAGDKISETEAEIWRRINKG
jgi:hypothetical protein